MRITGQLPTARGHLRRDAVPRLLKEAPTNRDDLPHLNPPTLSPKVVTTSPGTIKAEISVSHPVYTGSTMPLGFLTCRFMGCSLGSDGRGVPGVLGAKCRAQRPYKLSRTVPSALQYARRYLGRRKVACRHQWASATDGGDALWRGKVMERHVTGSGRNS